MATRIQGWHHMEWLAMSHWPGGTIAWHDKQIAGTQGKFGMTGSRVGLGFQSSAGKVYTRCFRFTASCSTLETHQLLGWG
jgi:hypothetical protein